MSKEILGFCWSLCQTQLKFTVQHMSSRQLQKTKDNWNFHFQVVAKATLKSNICPSVKSFTRKLGMVMYEAFGIFSCWRQHIKMLCEFLLSLTISQVILGLSAHLHCPFWVEFNFIFKTNHYASNPWLLSFQILILFPFLPQGHNTQWFSATCSKVGNPIPGHS